MDILQGVNYQYTSNGQQVGPVEGAQLVLLAQQGHVTAADHIWTEGMAEWLPATTFNQLAPLFQAQQQQADTQSQAQVQQVQKPASGLSRPIGAGGAPTARRGNPSRSGGSGTRSTSGSLPARRQFQATRPGASANLMFTLFFLPIVLFLAHLGIGVLMSSSGEIPDENAALFGIIMMVCGAAGWICLICYMIFTYIYLYRAWQYIQDILGLARTTPGAAVGMLFIPFFNLYWIFNVFPGWATDYNRYLDTKGATTVPRASNGLAIAAMLIPLAHPYMMADMCKGINNLANPVDPALQND